MVKKWLIITGAYLSAFYLIRMVFDYGILPNSVGYDYTHRLLLKRIFRVEMVYFPLNILIWIRVVGLAQRPVGSDVPNCNIKRAFTSCDSLVDLRSLTKAALIVFILARHSALLSVYNNKKFPVPYFLSFFIWTLFGFWFHLVAFLLFFECLNVALLVKQYIIYLSLSEIRRSFETVRREQQHRTCRHTKFAVVLAVVCCLICMVQASAPSIRQELVKIRNLPPSMRNTRLAVVTDVHLGPTVTVTQVELMVDLIMKQTPDAVLIVGDFMDGHVDQFRGLLPVLRRLKSKYGVFFVTGNHEYYFGEVDVLLNKLKSIGFHVLRNNSTQFGGMCLVGLDDLSSGKSGVKGHGIDIDQAISGCDPNKRKIVMAHNPLAAELVVKKYPNVDLVLCGHTHAGQIYVLAPVMYYTMPFYRGLYTVRNSSAQVFVSSGVFYWGTPMKMIGTAEIPLITLTGR